MGSKAMADESGRAKRYKTARALEMALKEAARRSGRDVNRAMADFWHGRLLERVFSEDDPSFVLKGGRGMLARTPSARYTRDTDMAYGGADADEAVSELRRLAAIDLGDHVEYRFMSESPIVEDQDYRDGRRVVFRCVLGGTKKVADVSVDVVVSDVPLLGVERIEPATRLAVAGIPTFDYRVYPVEESVADKVCATMSTYRGGMPSSRVRDLVDLVIYLTTEQMDGNRLSACLFRELRMGHMGEGRPFSVPDSWKGPFEPTYRKLAKECGLPAEFREVGAAEQMVAGCVNAALDGSSEGRRWDASSLCWRDR
jgi:hypothetical protein